MNTPTIAPQRGRPINETARQERMTQILDGARSCFVQHGFHASSIAQISAAAGVSVANIYQYFPNKEALICALIEADLQRHADMIARFWSGDLDRQAVRETLGELFLTKEGHEVAVLRAEIASESARNQEVAQMLQKSEERLFGLLRQVVRTAQEEGRISAAVDPQGVSERLALSFEGVMRLYVFSPSEGEALLERYYRQVAESLQLKG